MIDCDRLVNGIFISEDSTRFSCNVCIEGTSIKCYVSSSCHLEQLIVLKGKTVYLLPLKIDNPKFDYRLFAVKHKHSFIILDSTYANDLVFQSLSSRVFSFLGLRNLVKQEFVIENYRSDIYLPDTKTIIEIKSIISAKNNAPFLSVESKRFEKQFLHLQLLKNKGFKIFLFIVALNPYTKNIEIDSLVSKQTKLLASKNTELEIFGFALNKSEKKVSLRQVPIDWSIC